MEITIKADPKEIAELVSAITNTAEIEKIKVGIFNEQLDRIREASSLRNADLPGLTHALIELLNYQSRT